MREIKDNEEYPIAILERRIAELEAELAEYREAASYGRDMKARAEKAEAEVERLTNILRDILKHVGLCHDSSDSNLNSFYTWVDDTLGGGGRENDDNCNVCGMPEKEVKAHWDDKEPGFHFFKPKTAANPAALCICAVIIGRGPCPLHGWAAARKKEIK